MNSTALFGQESKTKDTLTCYNNTDMQLIAAVSIFADECDSLLKIKIQEALSADVTIEALQNESLAKDSVIYHTEKVVKFKEDIITGKDQEIKDLRNVLSNKDRRSKWLKIGWISTSAFLSGLLVLSLL